MPTPYSLAHLTALTHNPAQMVDLAARTGYSYAGLRLLPVAPGALAYPLMDNPALLAETLARMEDTGVGIFDLELIRLNANFNAQDYLAFFEVGERLGARAVLIAGDDREFSRLVENYARLCEAMQPYGLSADLEFMPWTAVPDLTTALRIVGQADQVNGGILIDALHFDRSDSRVEDIAKIPTQWLHYAQICDGPAQRPTTDEGLIYAARNERLLPGEGAIDLRRIWQSLPAELPISIEIPNEQRVAQVGVEAWARSALVAAKATLGPA